MQADESREPAQIATWSDLPDREPTHARVDGVDLVVIRDDDEVSVLKVMARACGHDSLAGFERRDLILSAIIS